jgi:3-methyladenine DNA glycosylase/8-oxoguanine DNA glycosylase
VGSRITIRAPDDFLLVRDVCSYGYFLLAPNEWDPIDRTLSRPLALPEGRVRVRIGQPEGLPGSSLMVECDRRLGRRERGELVRQVSRMLRLDESAEAIAAFHDVDGRWRASGRGRLYRSPTLFEDVVKTVTSCNVAWPSTIRMNARLCEVVDPAFPSAAQLARRRPLTLRSRCGVGYRDARLVELAKLFAGGAVDEARLEDSSVSDDEAFEALRELPGIGPYAAGNIMQLLGRYGRLAIDTETERHAREELGYREEGAALRAKVERRYARFGAHRFRSYWFEVWSAYERRRGPAWTWTPRGAGAGFTASATR